MKKVLIRDFDHFFDLPTLKSLQICPKFLSQTLLENIELRRVLLRHFLQFSDLGQLVSGRETDFQRLSLILRLSVVDFACVEGFRSQILIFRIFCFVFDRGQAICVFFSDFCFELFVGVSRVILGTQSSIRVILLSSEFHVAFLSHRLLLAIQWISLPRDLITFVAQTQIRAVVEFVQAPS